MCNCISEINKLLKPYNTKISVDINFGTGKTTPHIGTEKVDKKLKAGPQLVIATCCPFCGEKVHL
jgi:hypothetical protein